MRIPCKYAIKFEKHLSITVHFYFPLSVMLNHFMILNNSNIVFILGFNS